MTDTATLEAGATRQISDKEATKVAVGALIGTAMEWYDFFLFSAAAALVFNVQYFAKPERHRGRDWHPSPPSAWDWWPAQLAA